MGVLRIETHGSFGYEVVEFTAMKHGHADVVAQAIEHLAGNMLPRATALDHSLHSEGEKPEGGWLREDKEGEAK